MYSYFISLEGPYLIEDDKKWYLSGFEKETIFLKISLKENSNQKIFYFLPTVFRDEAVFKC